MKKFLYTLAIILAFPIGFAFAGGNELAYFKIQELPALTATSAASGDYMPLYDASAGKVKKVDIGANLAVLAGLAGLSAAELDYVDIATLGTLEASKAWTSDASLDSIMPTGGLLTVQSGGQITMNSGSTLAVSGTFTGATLSLTGDLSGDGGDQFFGFLQDQVASTTTSATAAQCGKTFVSDSADVLTLPEASTVLGCRYTFVCGTADDLAINPADGTDAISVVASITGTNTTTVLAPSAGDSITCTDIGSSIVLEAVGANLWASIGTANGIWTDTN